MNIPTEHNYLLMLSGGLDSAAGFYHLLRTGHRFAAHHVRIINGEGRAPHERKAVNDVLEWTRTARLPGRYIFSESTTDYGRGKLWLRDRHVWSFWAGAIFRAQPELDTLFLSRHADDFNHSGHETAETVAARREQANEEIQGIISSIAGREVELVAPFLEIPKRDLIASIPPELAQRAWYCRRPVGGHVKCGRCFTCKQVGDAIAATLRS